MTLVKRNVLVVGQKPPPWHGQNIAIQALVDSEFEEIDLHFVSMDFSRQIDEVGRFGWRKVALLPLLISRIWWTRFRKNCEVLYYPPGGTTISAVARDISVLLCCRMLFSRVVFHSHAGGFMEIAEAGPFVLRILARIAYRRPDVLIQLTPNSPPDANLTRAARVVYVPYGLHDHAASYMSVIGDSDPSRKTRLLFVGSVSRGKGVMTLLEACAELVRTGDEFFLQVVGNFYPSEFEQDCESFINDTGLHDHVKFVGPLIGDEKWRAFCEADIFCFPSSYKAENQPLVILEAMQFAVPVVASDWRGIPTMVKDGETGFIVPVEDSVALANRIRRLMNDPGLRTKMGEKARSLFLERYTVAVWRPAMESALRGA
jgi:glycosyltransferase involved in cell wall biosynthesis